MSRLRQDDNTLTDEKSDGIIFVNSDTFFDDENDSNIDVDSDIFSDRGDKNIDDKISLLNDEE
jgi:hypothetical protein